MRYLIRLDDACPTMDKLKWGRVEKILDDYRVKPMVGIIPANADQKQIIHEPDPKFWRKVKKWESKGWAIALHGYDHCYISNKGGLNPIWARSEFAGVPLDVQKEKIRNGITILKAHGITPKYFFAQSHTYDENTLIALREESEIRVISDTIATKPYKKFDFIFIPQVVGSCRKMIIPGVWTFCLHPSVMTEEGFENLEEFIKNNSKSFVSFDSLPLDNVKSKTLMSKILSSLYFTIRKIKGIS